MGWWRVEGTQDTIGDSPLDTLSSAVAAVLHDYRSAFGRRPTKAEWEALLGAVLGAEEPQARVLDSGFPTRVRLDVE